MTGVLLAILKILGIFLLVLLGIILFALIMALFVPVRYNIRILRKMEDDSFVRITIKVSWLLHIINGAFSYPQEAFFRIRFLWFTIFRSDGGGKKSSDKKKKEKKGIEAAEKTLIKEEIKDAKPPEQEAERKEKTQEKEKTVNYETEKPEKESLSNRLLEFWGKIWSFLKNIQYTITRICDKIKHIVKNIQYYVRILQGDEFHDVWQICGGEAVSLLRSILPRKLEGQLHVGAGDPAGTGRILSVYGILYPLIGNHINILPDFEQAVLEGELFAKGRITVFKVLKTAWVVYFNKDLRRLIKLLKREAA